MGWLNDWWNRGNSPRVKPPVKVEVHNVGKLHIKATYLDAHDKVVSSVGYIYGYCEWQKDPPLGCPPKVVQIYASQAYSAWLKSAMESGVYDIEDGNKSIPRERMREFIAFEEDFEVTVHYEPEPKNS